MLFYRTSSQIYTKGWFIAEREISTQDILPIQSHIFIGGQKVRNLAAFETHYMVSKHSILSEI